jgi:integrase
MLQGKNVRTRFFEVEAFQGVVRGLPAALRPVATFAHITGWRKEAVLALTWRQVDFEAEVVRLEPGTTKNGEERTFFTTAELKRLLEGQSAMTMAIERQAGQIIPWVFHRNRNPIRSFKVAW